MSPINLGELTKPATVLVEKISDAIGGVFRPYQIRRIAEAEAYADRVNAASKIEITELQRRSMQRFFSEEAKKQQNIEAITTKALPELTAAADPQQIEDDWITNFFDKCRLISDGEMQTLWGRVLAGEANSPGRYSKRTISALSSLDKGDAELFRTLCSFCWTVEELTPLIYASEPETIYSEAGIDFTALKHLDEIGLITFDSHGNFARAPLPEMLVVQYYGKEFRITVPVTTNNELDVGEVLFSKTGSELALVCGSAPRSGFPEYVIAKWRSIGLQVVDLSQESAPVRG